MGLTTLTLEIEDEDGDKLQIAEDLTDVLTLTVIDADDATGLAVYLTRADAQHISAYLNRWTFNPPGLF